jgi:hypothetical protein
MDIIINKEKTIILIKIILDNIRSISIDREFIIKKITPNFTVEMCNALFKMEHFHFK